MIGLTQFPPVFPPHRREPLCVYLISVHTLTHSPSWAQWCGAGRGRGWAPRKGKHKSENPKLPGPKVNFLLIKIQILILKCNPAQWIKKKNVEKRAMEKEKCGRGGALMEHRVWTLYIYKKMSTGKNAKQYIYSLISSIVERRRVICISCRILVVIIL